MIALIITFKVICHFLAFLGISRPFPSLSRRDHGTGNESLCPVPISRRDGTSTWKTRPLPSRGEAYSYDTPLERVEAKLNKLNATLVKSTSKLTIYAEVTRRNNVRGLYA